MVLPFSVINAEIQQTTFVTKETGRGFGTQRKWGSVAWWVSVYIVIVILNTVVVENGWCTVGEHVRRNENHFPPPKGQFAR